MATFDKIIKTIAEIIRLIVIVCAISLVIVVFTEVVLRAFFNRSLLWNDEISRFLFVWIVYFGMAYALYDDSHIKLDILSQRIHSLRIPLQILSWITTSFFFVVFLIYTFRYMLSNATKMAPATGIPYVIIYAVLPFTSGVGLLFLLQRAIHFVVEKKPINDRKEDDD